MMLKLTMKVVYLALLAASCNGIAFDRHSVFGILRAG